MAESKPQPFNEITNKIVSDTYVPKRGKILDKTKEKSVSRDSSREDEKKPKKGFFGTLKTFVGRSIESDSSESERSPIREKKRKEKRKKKPKDLTGLPPISPASSPTKPKLPTPPLGHPDIDSIPYVETAPEIETQISVAPDTIEVIEGKSTAPKKRSKVRVFEEVVTQIEPTVIEDDQFRIVIEHNKKQPDKTTTEVITYKISDDTTMSEKQPTPMPRTKIRVIQKPDGKIPNEVKLATAHLIQNEMNFAGWADDKHNVYKPEEHRIEITQTPPVVKKPMGIFSRLGKKLSKDVEDSDEDRSESIIEKHDRELSKESSAKDKLLASKEKKKKKKTESSESESEDYRKGIFGKFKKSKKPEEPSHPEIVSEDDKIDVKVLQQPDVIIDVLKKRPKPITLSTEILQEMSDSENFLQEEVARYDDVKVKIQQQDVAPESVETKSLFGLFGKKVKKDVDVTKSPKKDRAMSPKPTKTVELSEEVVQQMYDTKNFLSIEVAKYEDVTSIPFKQPEKPQPVIESPKKAEVDKESKKSVFTLFGKITKSVDLDSQKPKDEVTSQYVEETKEFLSEEVSRFEDCRPPKLDQAADTKIRTPIFGKPLRQQAPPLPPKPIIETITIKNGETIKLAEKTEQETADSKEQKKGMFGIFAKKPRRDGSVEKTSEVPITLSEETEKQMSYTTDFLKKEVAKYHDVKPVAAAADIEVQDDTKEKKAGLFGIFTKKQSVDKPSTKQPSEIITVTRESSEFLKEEVARFEDVRPVTATASLVNVVQPIEPTLIAEEQKEKPESIKHIEEDPTKSLETTSEFLEEEVRRFEDVRHVITKSDTEQKESPKKSLFGIFSKKPKRDSSVEKKAQAVTDTEEVARYHDAVQPEKVKDQKQIIEGVIITTLVPTGFTPTAPLPHPELQEMFETSDFLKNEVDNYHDVRPIRKVVKTVYIASPPHTSIELSEDIVIPSEVEMVTAKITDQVQPPIEFTKLVSANTNDFLQQEIERFHDVKEIKVPEATEPVDERDQKRTGIFDMFTKKPKRDESEERKIETVQGVSESGKVKSPEKKKKIQKEDVDEAGKKKTGVFAIFGKKTKPEETIEGLKETKVDSDLEDEEKEKRKSGVFSIFNKKVRDESLERKPAELASVTKTNMDTTTHFLKTEIDNFEDVKPLKVVKLETVTVSEDHDVDKRILELLAQAPRPEEHIVDVQPSGAIDEEVQQNIAATTDFLTEEVARYHDVKTVKLRKPKIDGREIKSESDDETREYRKMGLFGLFKRSKEDDEPKSDTEVVEVDSEKKKEKKHKKSSSLERRIIKEVIVIEDGLPSEEVMQKISDSKVPMDEETRTTFIESKSEHKDDGSESQKGGLFGMFKKSKKDQPVHRTIIKEVIVIHDGSPDQLIEGEVTETVTQVVEGPILQEKLRQGIEHSEPAKYDDSKETDEDKILKSELPDQKKTSLLGGLFGKKTKKSKEESSVEVDPLTEEAKDGIAPSSEFIETEIKAFHDVSSTDFLKQEIEKYHDVKRITNEAKLTPDIKEKPSEQVTDKKGGILEIHTKKTKKEEALQPTIIKEVIVVQETVLPSTKPDSNKQQIMDASDFLNQEIEKYHDVKSILPERKDILLTKQKSAEEEPHKKSGIFTILPKKPKRERSPQPTIIKEVLVVQETAPEHLQTKADASDFLTQEVEKYHDVRPIVPTLTSEAKEKVSEEIAEKKGGFFGIFTKKTKKDETIQPTTISKEVIVVQETAPSSLEPDVKQQMMVASDFLNQEIQKYHDVKSTVPERKDIPLTKQKSAEQETDKKSGIFSILSKKPKRDGSPQPTIIKEVLVVQETAPVHLQPIAAASDFLTQEVDKYHDVKPIVPTLTSEATENISEDITDKKGGLFGIFTKKTKTDETVQPTTITKEVIVVQEIAPTSLEPNVKQQMMDASDFLNQEIKKYHDVKSIVPERKDTPLTKQKSAEQEPDKKSGIFSILSKKPRRDGSPQPTVIKEVLVVEETGPVHLQLKADASDFLTQEVEKYHDVKPIVPTLTSKSTEKVSEDITDKKGGLFGIFTKKTKKDETVQPTTIIKEVIVVQETAPTSLEPDVKQQMMDASDFLNQEIQKYHDVKSILPERKDILLTKQKSADEEPDKKSGIFSILSKKPKRDGSPQPTVIKEILVVQETAPVHLAPKGDTSDFLTQEVEKYHDVKPIVSTLTLETKEKVPEEIVDTKGGFFGIFTKKTKKDETVQPTTIIKEVIVVQETAPTSLEPDVKQQMTDASDFLNQEIQKYHDVKSIVPERKDILLTKQKSADEEPDKKRGIFSILSTKPKRDGSPQPTVMKDVLVVQESAPVHLQPIADASDFLTQEVEKYHDVKPIVPTLTSEATEKVSEDITDKKGGLFGIFTKKTKKDETVQPTTIIKEVIVVQETAPTSLEPDVKQQITDASDFLNQEIQKYHDVKSIVPERKDILLTKQKSADEEPDKKSGIFSILSKKPKRDGSPQPTVIKEILVVQETAAVHLAPKADTSDFLTQEVEKYHDVKPIVPNLTSKSTEKVSEDITDKKGGLFGIFTKKTKKDETVQPTTIIKEVIVVQETVPTSLEPDVKQQMMDASDFLNQEIQKYHDVKSIEPERKDILLTKQKSADEEPDKKRGIFSILSTKPKRDGSPQPTVMKDVLVVQESAPVHLQPIADASDFLTQEVENYHDVRPIVPTLTPEAKEKVSEDITDKKGGLFGIFTKKTKQDETVQPTTIIKEVIVVQETAPTSLEPDVKQQMMDASDFLNQEIEKYHDVKSIVSEAKDILLTKQKSAEEEPGKKSGILSILSKKPKRDGSPQPTVIKEVLVVQETASVHLQPKADASDFLTQEVEKYHDVRPFAPTLTSETKEKVSEETTDKKGGLFGIFAKKTKKDETVQPTTIIKEVIVVQETAPTSLEPDVKQQMMDSSDFLNQEIEKYHDIKDKTTEAVSDTKKAVKDTAHDVKAGADEAASKTGKFFSGLGDKISGKAKDAKDAVIETEEKIKDKTTEAVSDTKQAVKDTAHDVKAGADEAASKTGKFFSGLGDKISGKAKDAKDAVIETEEKIKDKTTEAVSDTKQAVKDTAHDVKAGADEAASKTGKFFSGLGDKISGKAKDAKDAVIETEEKIKDKTTEAVSDTKQAVKDTAHDVKAGADEAASKTGKFFSGLGDKISGKAKDAKDAVIETEEKIKDKTTEAVSDTKKAVKDTAHDVKAGADEAASKTGKFFSGLGDKISGKAKDAKDAVIETEEKIKDKTTEAVSDTKKAVKDTAHDVKAGADEAASKTGKFFSGLGDKISGKAKDAKDAVIETEEKIKDKTTEAVSDTKKAVKDTTHDVKAGVDEAASKTGKFFSGLGDKISGKAKDAKDAVIETEEKIKDKTTEAVSDTKQAVKDTAHDVKAGADEAASKTGKFFSGLGDKISGKAKDAKDAVIETEEKIKDKTTEAVSDTKKAVKDTAHDVKAGADEAASKTGKFFSGLGDKISGKAKDAKDAVIETEEKIKDKTTEAVSDTKKAVKDTAHDVKAGADEAASKTGKFFSGLGDKISGKAKDAKDAVIETEEKIKDKTTEAVSDTKKAVKDTAHDVKAGADEAASKTGKFFSGLGDKISGKAKDAKDAVIETEEKIKDKTTEAVSDTKKAVKDTAHDVKAGADEAASKTGKFFSGLGDKISGKAKDAKDAVIETEEKIKDKTTEAVSDTKKAVKDTAHDVKAGADEAASKTGKFFSGLGDKISGKAKDAKDAVIETEEKIKDKTTEAVSDTKQAVKDTAHDVKAGADEAASKTGKFFSGLGDKISGKAKDAKDAVIETEEKIKDKTTEAVSDTKKAVKDTAHDVKAGADEAASKTGKFFSGLGDKISGKAKDAKDAVIETEEKIKDKTTEAVSDTKKAVKDTAHDVKAGADEAASKTGKFFSGLGDKISGKAKDAKDAVIETEEKIKDKTTEAVSDTKQAVKDTAHDVKAGADEAASKTGKFFSGLGDKISGKAKDAKDAVIETEEKIKDKTTEAVSDTKQAVKDTAHDVKAGADEAASKTGKFFSGLETEEKIKDKTTEAVSDTKRAAKDTAHDVKAGADEAASKTGKFFSGLGDKISGKAKDAKDAVIETEEKIKDKTTEAVSDTKQAVKDTAHDVKAGADEAASKTGKFFSGLGDKISGKAKDAKDAVIETEEKIKDKTTEAVSDTKKAVKDTAHDVKAGADEAASKTGKFFSGLETEEKIKDKTTEAVSDTKKAVKDTAHDVKAGADEAASKTGKFFSGLETEEKIKDKTTEAVSDTKKAVKDTAHDVKAGADEAASKTGKFFSGLGDKISGRQKTLKMRGLGDKISGKAKDAKDAVIETEEKIKDKTTEAVSDTKKAVKDTAHDVKAGADEAASKTGKFFSGLGDKISGKAKDAKDAVIETEEKIKDKTTEAVSDTKKAVKDTAHDAKAGADEAASKTGKFFSGLGDKISGKAKDAKDAVIETEEKIKDKTTEAVSDTKKAVKDTAHDVKAGADEAASKTGKFFSGLGDKISGKAKDAKDAVIETEEKIKDKTTEAVSDTKKAVKDTAHDAKAGADEAASKTGKFFSGLGDKISGKAKDAKDAVIETEETIKDKTTEAVSDTKKAVKDTAHDRLGDKISGKAKDAKDAVIETEEKIKDKTTEAVSDTKKAVKDTAHDVKAGADEAASKTGKFFSGLGDKISGKQKTLKMRTEEKIKDKTTEAVSDTKKAVKDTAHDVKAGADEAASKTGKFFSGLGDKISGKAKDAKDAVIETEEKIKDKTTEAVSDTKKAVKDTAHDRKAKDAKDAVIETEEKIKDKTTEAVSDTKKAVKDTAHDAKAGADEAASKTGKFFSDWIKDKTTEAVSDTKKAVKDTAHDVKAGADEAASKTGKFFSGLGDKISGKAKDAKDAVIETEETIKDKTTEAVSDTKKAVKDTAHDVKAGADEAASKTGKFFSGLGDKISGKAKDAKDAVIETEEKIKDKTTEAVSDTKKAVKDTAHDVKAGADEAASKTGKFFSGLGDKISGKAKDAKDAVIETEEKIKDKTTEAVSDTKKAVKDTAHDVKAGADEAASKTGKFFSGLGDKISGKAKDAKDAMISELSSEDLSDLQKEYSTLWDSHVISSSEEKSVKTPGSQADVQELPQGEVIYMGPVNLNKDHVTNKAGIEVNVIPIMRSPYQSPTPVRKIKRPHSELGYNTKKVFEERGSLPDLYNSHSSYEKGSILHAILKKHPSSFLEQKSDLGSTQSLFGSSTEQRSPPKSVGSTDSLSKGALTSAVMSWLSKASPFSSCESLEQAIVITDDNDNEAASLCYSNQADSLLPHSPTEKRQQTNLVKKSPPCTVDKWPLDASFGLTQTSAELTPSEIHLMTETPIPKPRITKTTDLDVERESQKSPVRDDLLDTDVTPKVEEEKTTYKDKKKFWETIASDTIPESTIPTMHRMSLHDELIREKPSLTKRISLHEEHLVRPIPKPRCLTQTSESSDDSSSKPLKDQRVSFDSTTSATSESTETTHVSTTDIFYKDPSRKIMSEYQSQFQDPFEKKPTPLKVEFRSEESFDSDRPLVSQEQGYISDSEDVEHYISDSEIEDRVPQIRTRQMSVFQPAIPMRKSIYERSLSLPTEDLYDVSASMRLRKQYFEEQLRKELVEEQFTTESEEETSPERKALYNDVIPEVEPSGTRSVPENAEASRPSVRDLAKAFDQTSSSKEDLKQTKMDEYAELFMSEQRKFSRDVVGLQDTHKPIVIDTHKFESQEADEQELETHKPTDLDCQIKRSSTMSEKSLSDKSLESSDGNLLQYNDTLLTKDDSISRPNDSMEVHVDKSEVEDSEKITDFETDVETKSLDSLNAVDIGLRATESIPAITFTLSGKQRRISEDSDESFDAGQQDVSVPTPISEQSEVTSPVHHPEQHVDSTVWETSVQSQPSFERVSEFMIDNEIKVPKDDDRSESLVSDRKTDSHSDIEQIILESLQNQNILPEEARRIADELLEGIEVEIQKLHHIGSGQVALATTPEVAKAQVSDYLRQLAETKGLDSREVQLVESVLARKQRQFAKLKRDDTQASSMEITDEDLKFSGTELDYSPSASQALILEQLEAEKCCPDIKTIFDTMKKEYEDKFSTTSKIDETCTDESFTSKGKSSTEDDKQTSLKSEVHTKTTETVTSEKVTTETQGEDELKIATEDRETKLTDSVQKAHVEELDVKSTRDEKTSKTTLASSSEHIVRESDTQISSEDITSDKGKIEKVTIEATDQDTTDVEAKIDIETKKMIFKDDKIIDTLEKEKHITEGFIQKEVQSTIDDTKKITVEEDGTIIEREEIIEKTHIKLSTTSVSEDESRKEVTITAKLNEIESKVLKQKEEIERTLSDESKSSQDESVKSPEDVFSTCSSGRKGDSDTTSKTAEKHDVVFRRSKIQRDAESSSSSGNLKPDRKSGIDFEAYSSSGESHYHSFDLDSGKSRPCSSDVEGLLAAASSEYESALTSQDISGRSHLISEYHTAASSLSSKESMKSLDSESSGNLASVEVSEISETLVASELEYQGDEDDVKKDKPIRQGTQYSDSDLLSYPDLEGSIDVSEDEFCNEPKLIEDVPSRMKRSYEMTFQPEPKVLMPESPQSETAQEVEEKFGTSMDEGSVLSVSLSSTSSVAALRTVIELSRADSERLEGSMNISATSEQLSLDDMDNFLKGSRESLVCSHLIQESTATTDSSTSTHPQLIDLSGGSVTLTSSMIVENGVQNASTQVTSRSHTPTSHEEQAIVISEIEDSIAHKKKGHRRTESASFTSSHIPSTRADIEKQLRSELAESDKYTTELSFKEVSSDEKKDVDETEREESYETEADQDFHRGLTKSQTDKEKHYGIERELSSPEVAEELEMKDDTFGFSVCEPLQEAVALASEVHETVKRSSKDDKIAHKETLDRKETHVKTSASSSERSSFEEAEAEAAFNMVAHISPAHKVKQICPILEDEDAEKHELETRELAQKELEERRAQIRDHSPGSIPDIKVTQHMAPLVDRGFHYPDLELEEQEAETQKSTPETPASNSSKTSEETDQGKEYVLDNGGVVVLDEMEGSVLDERSEKGMTESKSEVGTVFEKTIEEAESQTESPDSDSFEMLEKPDLMEDFVIIEEVGKEAFEQDTEGKSIKIFSGKKIPKKHDEEVENYLIKSSASPATKMTDLKYYPDGSSSEDLGFEFDDSPPQLKQKGADGTTKDSSGSRDYVHDYDRELEANKKWMEQQFHGDQAIMMAAGYGYEMDFERAPLEDIKEEEITDFDPSSSRIGSVGSQKESGGSLGSAKDSFSSTPDYDVLAGRKYFTRSGENDDISMSSLQEFENLERAMSLENRRIHQGSQDSSSNGSFGKRYYASRNAQGDDVSVSSLKEFEGLEKACIAVHKIEQKVMEEEAMLTQIEEGQESIASESESCETVSGTDKKLIPDSDDEDYEKRMFEIDEIIRQAQSNVEKFIDMKDDEKPESIGRGDSLEEVSKVPDLDLDTPIFKDGSSKVWPQTDDLMATSTDSLDIKLDRPSRNDSTDSLDQKTAADIMTTSTDSIEFQSKQRIESDVVMSDSIEFKDVPDYSFMMTSSDSLELETGTGAQVAALLSDSMDEDGSRICAHDQSSSSTGKDFSSSVREEPLEQFDRDQLGYDAHDPLDISTSTATHATCQYETDSVFSGSFTSGGSNTMVSSTDTIDPTGAHVDLAAAVRKVWFDDDSDAAGRRFTTEYVDDSSKPYVTEVIEPCDDDDFYSHTIHRRVELPPEVRKVTFKGSDAEEQMRQYMLDFGEGEDVQEFEEVDADGNVHVKRIIQKRYIIKSDDTVSDTATHDLGKSTNFDGQGVIKRTYTDGQGAKTIYTQKFGLKHMEGQDSTSAAHSSLSSISSDTTGSSNPQFAIALFHSSRFYKYTLHGTPKKKEIFSNSLFKHLLSYIHRFFVLGKF
ncbi:hypothetical protein FQA39_LY05510 [Lamprigera yunnana]|nr:hypothetical protein FQA39_LY05510 [Lamprigera yunnana]